MSDGEAFRPRRAWQSDDDADALSQPTPSAAEEPTASPKRGSVPAEEPVNPFARPGSRAYEEAAPTPSVPMIPPPVFPRSAGEYSDSPSPAPRRSAMSSTTPVEVEQTAPAASWVSAHRRTLALWAVAALVGALVVGLIAFFITRGAVEPDPSAAPTSPTAASSSASPSADPITASDLVTPEDLSALAPASAWAITGTTQTAADHALRAVCLSTNTEVNNPVHSFQRIAGTTGDDQLAALHRVDTYTSDDTAAEVMTARAAALASCSEVPARIVRSSSVTGLAEESFQVTIVLEDQVSKFHTVLMTRSGDTVQLLDVARNASPLGAETLAEALSRPQTDISERQDQTAPSDPSVAEAVVPPTPPRGWLTAVDLPRIRPGAGRWTMSGPGPLDSSGMGCENMVLATEAGPTSREQSTYAMTQDEQAPPVFGIDEMLFTFGSPEEAAVFVTKLGTSLATCGDRVNTATVTEHPAVAARDAEGNALSSRVFTITQAISDTATSPYQLIVSVAGNKVAYTLITVTDAYKFSETQLAQLAGRVPVRASQAG